MEIAAGQALWSVTAFTGSLAAAREFKALLTQHDIRASLYAPLRVLIYENEEGKTCVVYDRPSSLFGQFGDSRIAPTATMLDRKLEALVAKAIE